MKRNIYSTLVDWKNDKNRKPLLVRGARQTGKTWIVSRFGKEEFEQFIYINFERNPEYKEIFTTRDPSLIIKRINLYLEVSISPGKCLMFLDEIQDCPDAIIALRYFYEEMPEQHIIGAGSLLEFGLKSSGIKVPVGRIQYVYLYPLSFGEFLTATGDDQLRVYISETNQLSELTEGLHNKLRFKLKQYFIIGGMPAVVKAYIESGNIIKCKRIQQSIVDTFLDDFAKYARDSTHKYMRMILTKAPGLLGQKFVYSNIDRTMKSRDLKSALLLLETAGIVKRVISTSGSGIPLSAEMDDNFFKVILLDIGLIHVISGIDGETYLNTDLTSVFRGGLAEQFAGQEILANQSPYTNQNLYYWFRKARNSQAEVDYLIAKNNAVIPVEIKAGSTGHLKSLHLFMDKHKSEVGLKISEEKYQTNRKIHSIPLYAMEYLMKDKATF